MSNPPPFDPTSPDWRAQATARTRHRARTGSGVVPVRGDFIGRTFTLAEVAPGWPVYSTTRRYDTEYPIGGVVVDVLPARLDTETGELVPTRYRVLDVGRRLMMPWHTLEAPEVDTSALAGVGRQQATSAAYWLLERINKRRLVLHPDDVGYLRDAHVLGAAVVNL